MAFAATEALLAEHGLVLPTEAQWEYAADAGGSRPSPRGRANLVFAEDPWPMSHAPIGMFPASAAMA